MNLKPFFTVAVAALALSACSGSPADNNGAIDNEVATTIKARQDNFKALGKASKAITDELKGSAPSFDVIATNAQEIHDSSLKIVDFFPEAGENSEGVKTAALPAIWEKHDEFKADATRLTDATNALIEAVASKDVAKTQTAFENVGASCKNCHDSFRAKKQ